MYARTLPRWTLLLGVFCMLLIPIGCSDDDPTGPGEIEPDPLSREDIDTDTGDIGVILDTRAMFKKGYVPATAEIAFADYPQYSATLEVDQLTNLVSLILDLDDLTETEVTAFGNGVAAQISIRDAAGTTLADIQVASLVLDNQNRPLTISTNLEFIAQPVELREGLPYLLQIEGFDYLVEFYGNYDIDPNEPYAENSLDQQLYFVPVDGEESTYWVECYNFDPGCRWGIGQDGGTWMQFTYPERPEDMRAVVFEQQEDGWVLIRLAGTDEYLSWEPAFPGVGPVLEASAFEEPDRFRLISDTIDWSISDRGTTFNQPAMPEVLLDFAYEGELLNCASTTLEEAVGRSMQRTRTTSVSMSESIALFAGAEIWAEAKLGLEVTSKVGLDIQGIGEAGQEVKTSMELSMGAKMSTSITNERGQTWGTTEEKTVEVSRVRTVTVPPQTGVEVYDAVKTVSDVKVPFVQVVRIHGQDADSGQALTGREIQTQMMFCFSTGVVTTVGANYVDISFRGVANIDQLFKATTNVVEIEGACN